MLKNCKKKIVVGIVGLGVGAFHLKNSLAYNKCHVKYICDFNSKKLNYYKKKYNIKNITKNFDDILNDQEVNTLIIASYDSDHFYQVSEGLKKNKNIFVEKPLCLTSEELSKIINIKKKNPHLILSSNLVLRTHPFFEKIIKERKNFKKIYYLEGDYNYGRLNKLTAGWRGKIKNYSVILGGGIHLIDLILKIKKTTVKEVYSLSNKIVTSKLKNIPSDFCVSTLKFNDGSVAKVSSNFSSASDHHHIFNLYASNTSIFYQRNHSYQCFRENKNKNVKKISFVYENKMKSKLLYNFFDVVNNKNNTLLVSENELFNLMKICMRLVESAKKNKILKL